MKKVKIFANLRKPNKKNGTTQQILTGKLAMIRPSATRRDAVKL